MSESRFPEPQFFEEFKFARELLAREIQYRRDRQWQIFSWTSSVLIGVAGGVVALSGTDKGFVMGINHKVFLCAAVVVLTLWTCYWLSVHSGKERSLGARASICDARLPLGVGLYFASSPWRRGYITALPLLALAAILIIATVEPRPSTAAAGTTQPGVAPATPPLPTPR